jgi:hypothetical protein
MLMRCFGPLLAVCVLLNCVCQGGRDHKNKRSFYKNQLSQPTKPVWWQANRETAMMHIGCLNRGIKWIDKLAALIDEWRRNDSINSLEKSLKVAAYIEQECRKVPLYLFNVMPPHYYKSSDKIVKILRKKHKIFYKKRQFLKEDIGNLIQDYDIAQHIKGLIDYTLNHRRRQGFVIKKLSDHLTDLHGCDYVFEHNGGVCFGLSVLWSYGHYLLSQKRQLPCDDGYFFRDVSRLFLAAHPKIPYTDHEKSAINRFVSLILWFQSCKGDAEGVGYIDDQMNLQKKIQDTKGRLVKKRVCRFGFYTPKKLIALLKDYFLAPHKLLFIGVYEDRMKIDEPDSHAISLHVNAVGDIVYYDPNRNIGPLLIDGKNIGLVVRLIFKADADIRRDMPYTPFNEVAYISLDRYSFDQENDSIPVNILPFLDFMSLFTDKMAGFYLDNKCSMVKSLLEQMDEATFLYFLDPKNRKASVVYVRPIQEKAFVFWALRCLFYQSPMPCLDESILSIDREQVLRLLEANYLTYHDEWIMKMDSSN